MTAAWLVLALCATAPAATGPRLEAALVIPPAAGIAFANQNVLHDAQSGVTLVTNLDAALLASLLDGSNGRFVSGGATWLDSPPGRIQLPLGGGEMPYVALRDGRPQTVNVANPAAVTIEATAELQPAGARLRLRLTTVQLETQQAVEQLNRAPVGEPVFTRSGITLEQTLAHDRPLLVLLAANGTVNVGEHRLDVTVRRQVGQQVVEAAAPLLGLVLRLVPPGGALHLAELTPPVAPPGQVRIDGAVARPGLRPYQVGMPASELLVSAQPEARAKQLEVARLAPDGRVERFDQALPPAAADFALQERDALRVADGVDQKAAGGAGRRVEPPVQAAEGAAPRPAPPAPGAPAMALGAPAADAAPAANVAAGTNVAATPSRGVPVDELTRVAPAAARANEATAALRGRSGRGGKQREILLCATVVGADGLLFTAPARALEGVTDLRVRLADGRDLPCRKMATDEDSELVALRVDARDLTPLALRDDFPPVGTPVAVLGHPYGLVRSVTVTVVGGPPRELEDAPGADLQLDGALALGNSGGPVVDLQGRLVGLAYGTLDAPEAGPAISLAVSAQRVAAFLKRLAGR